MYFLHVESANTSYDKVFFNMKCAFKREAEFWGQRVTGDRVVTMLDLGNVLTEVKRSSL